MKRSNPKSTSRGTFSRTKVLTSVVRQIYSLLGLKVYMKVPGEIKTWQQKFLKFQKGSFI